MKRLVEFQVGDETGEMVLVEVDEPIAEAGLERAARRGEVTGTAARTIAESIGSVLPAAQTVLAELRSHLQSPDEITLTFGIKLSGGFNAVVASGQGEANFQVNVKWKRATPSSAVPTVDGG